MKGSASKKVNTGVKKRIGIAFSGGGSKGYIYLGVIKALEEYGIKFDEVAGTSVGSIFGAFYAAGYTYEQMYEIAKNIEFKDIKDTKIFPAKTDKLQQVVTNHLGKVNIEDLQTPFHAVATDLKSLREVVISSGSVAKACAGSCAVPGLFVPVRLDDKILCDGGLKNAMPADVLKRRGCDMVISINIGGENKKAGISTTKVFDVLLCALQILINDTSYKGHIYSDLVISPDISKFSFRKKNNLQDMIKEGYEATINAMPEILEIFKDHTKKAPEFSRYVKKKKTGILSKPTKTQKIEEENVR